MKPKLKCNTQLFKSYLTIKMIVPRLMCAVLSATFIQSSLAAGEKELEVKCGRCHSVTSELDRSEFDDLLSSYNWANWASVPLRVWISNHHKPRIPSINISEAEAAKISGYIADLSSQGKLNGTTTSGSDEFFADAEGLDTVDPISDSAGEEVELEQHDKNDHAETAVDFSECLNC